MGVTVRCYVVLDKRELGVPWGYAGEQWGQQWLLMCRVSIVCACVFYAI